MLKHSPTPETIHVANWLIYSGHVDLEQLVTKAREAKQREYDDGWDEGDGFACRVGFAAAGSLFSALDDTFDTDFEFCLLPVSEFTKPEQFGDVAQTLILPLLAPIFDRVCWPTVGAVILDCVNEPASI